MEEPAVKLHEHYKIYRDYLQHEDSLVNHRLSWSLTTNSLLLAAFGYNLHAQPSPNATKAAALLGVLLPIMGAAISFLSWLSIRSALSAIDQLTKSWKKIYQEAREANNGSCLKLPELSGGDSSFAKKHGGHAPIYTAAAFIVLWLAIIAALLYLGYPERTLSSDASERPLVTLG